jgi:hypothetical protein
VAYKRAADHFADLNPDMVKAETDEEALRALFAMVSQPLGSTSPWGKPVRGNRGGSK